MKMWLSAAWSVLHVDLLNVCWNLAPGFFLLGDSWMGGPKNRFSLVRACEAAAWSLNFPGLSKSQAFSSNSEEFNALRTLGGRHEAIVEWYVAFGTCSEALMAESSRGPVVVSGIPNFND